MKAITAVLSIAVLSVGHPALLHAETLQLGYSTYLGGEFHDEGYAIAVDTSGCAYVTGETYSYNFPTSNPYQSSRVGSSASEADVFVSKLSSTGSALLYSTYLGGSDKDYSYAISVENGLAYVAGATGSVNFPTLNSYQSSLQGFLTGPCDAFVSKLSSTGSALLYSTYLGGWGGNSGRGISVENGLAYVAGFTYAINFPTSNPYQSSLDGIVDVFVSKLSSTGSALLYSTYLGGSDGDSVWGYDGDYGCGISVENSLAYVAGWTSSTDFPTSNPYQSSLDGFADVFVSKLSSTGSALLYSTYLGGSDGYYVWGYDGDHGGGISVENGLAYVTGWTSSTDFPTSNPYQSSLDGFGGRFVDVFVSKLSSTGSTLLYSTYLGGEYEDYGRGISVENGLAYVTGRTESNNFPTSNPYQSSLECYDAFISKFSYTGSVLLYSTYLGGSDGDSGRGISVENGLAYVTGSTNSTNFPTLNPYQTSNGGDIGGGHMDAFVSRLNSYLPEPTPEPTPAFSHIAIDSGDYNGDGTSDIAIFRGSSGMWSVRNLTRVYFGSATDDLVPGDYNGDGTTDIAIFRENSGMWSVRNLSRFYLGITGDVPVPGDYEGNGTAVAGLFRASGGLWAIRDVTRVYFGASGDSVAPGYYDANTTKDIAVFRGSSGMWSARNITRFYFGASTDDLVPGDYNGADKWEGGIFRESTGLWSIRNVTRVYLGSTDDWALPADYNGDGLDDAGIFRDSAGMWSVRNLTRVYFGATSDIPVTR